MLDLCLLLLLEFDGAVGNVDVSEGFVGGGVGLLTLRLYRPQRLHIALPFLNNQVGVLRLSYLFFLLRFFRGRDKRNAPSLICALDPLLQRLLLLLEIVKVFPVALQALRQNPHTIVTDAVLI